MTSRPTAAQHLRDLARLRRVRDRIHREYAQPPDIEVAVVHGETGEQTDQESRSEGTEPQVDFFCWTE